MALSTREVLMIIRAKDLASSEIARIGTAFSTLDTEAQAAARSMIAQGSALMGVGAAFGIAGGAAIGFYAGSAKAAMEYNREAALTLTQVDQLGVTLEDVGDIGVRVARAIPAPFKEMQSALYDIFSSMDVTVKESETLLTAFSKAAVAGQTSIQTAGRATIAILNAFELGAEDVTRVMDVQFQVVRKGVVTYEEFATTIGRAIPSARNAGQSIEELGGMIAFLTRNGLSAAMAATSAARAMDLFANPKFAKEMKELGIAVFDTAGNFRPLHEVVGELNKVMGDMTAEEQAAALKELTKGAGGTIQAMRFMNVAVRDTNGSLKTLGDFVRNSAGELEAAYKIMANTPAARIQALTNTWQIFRKEMGDATLPTFAAVAMAIEKVLNWFLDLDDKTKDLVFRVGLLVAIFITLTGILTAIAGAVLILRGAFVLLHGAMLPITLTVGAFAALTAGVMYLATETKVLQGVWEALSSWVTNTFKPALTTAIEIITLSWSGFIEAFNGASIESTGIVGFFTNLGEIAGGVFRDIKQGAEDFWFAFKHPEAINEQNVLMATWGATVRTTLDTAILGAKAFWSAFNGEGITSDGFVGIMEQVGVKAREVFDALKQAWNDVTAHIAATIEEEGILGAIKTLGLQVYNWVKNEGLPQLIEAFGTWGAAAVSWVTDHLDELLLGLAALLKAILDFIGEQLPHIVDAGLKIIGALVQGIIDNKAEISKALLIIMAVIVDFIIFDLIPAAAKAFTGLIEVGGNAIGDLGRSMLKGMAILLGELIGFIATQLIPGIIGAFLQLPKLFADNVAEKIVSAVTAPFRSIFNTLVGRSIIPDTVNAGLEEWNRFKDKSGTTFDEMSVNLTGKTEGMKGSLVKLFQETGVDSHDKWKEAIDKMPGSSQEVSEQTYNAITEILAGLPGWTGGTGHETQAQWVVNLGKGTGGTRGTTGDWAAAMAAILNQLLTGVGASPIELGNTAGPQSSANGNIFEFFAKGGFEDHVAQIASGTMRVWAEPETGGEAYIPLAQSKRERSVKILREVAERFGMAIADYQEGGIRWPEVPDFSSYGNMIGTRGGKDSVTYTRDAIIAWNTERERRIAEQAAAAGGSSSTSGLTEAAQAMVNAVLSNFPDQTFTSGFRTPEENARVGGAPNSDHLYGRAADFGPGSDAVANFLYNYPGIKQVLWQVAGHYDHVHGAVYDQGGVLQRGLSMIMNGTGKPEAVFNWDQFQAIEWLMGHADKVAEASAAAPSPQATQEAAGAVSGQSLMHIGGKPGVAPSLGMMVETAQHTAGILNSNADALTKISAFTGGVGSINRGIGENREAGIGLGGSAFGSPGGFGFNFGSSGSIQTSQGPVFHEGAISMQITGSNPEQIAALVEAKIRELIANIRMR